MYALNKNEPTMYALSFLFLVLFSFENQPTFFSFFLKMLYNEKIKCYNVFGMGFL